MSYVPGVLVEDITKLTEDEWKEERKKGIGGSDASKILGVSPFATRKELFWDKCNIPHENNLEEENWLAKEIGHLLEPLVIKIFERKHPGWKVIYDRRMFFHPQYPWMLANVDALVMNPHTGDLYILEVKTTSVNALDRWGKKNSNVVPPEYEAQGRHYMAVLGIKGVIFICLGGNQEDGYRERWILRNPQKEKALIEAEADFWLNYVQKRIEPPYNDGENAKMVLDALDKHYKRTKEIKEIPAALRGNMEGVVKMNSLIAEEKKKVKELEKKRDKSLAPVLEYLKGSEGVLGTVNGGKYYLTYQERNLNSVKSDDLCSMRLEFPEAYDKFVKETDAGFWKIKEQAPAV